MDFYGDFADAKLARDLFIQASGDDQLHHFALARTERRVTFSKRTKLGFCEPADLRMALEEGGNDSEHLIGEELEVSRCTETPEDVDALFTLPLPEFIGARKVLAARLKKAGHGDEANQVKALAKPSISAWAVTPDSR